MSGTSQIEVNRRFSPPPCTWLTLTLTGENGVACRTHKPNPNRDQLSRCPTYSHLKKFLVISDNVATITWIWIWSSYFRIAAPRSLPPSLQAVWDVMPIEAAGAVGHPVRGHVALTAVEGIGDGARGRRRPRLRVRLVAAVDALLTVVANAAGLAVHLNQMRRWRLENYEIFTILRRTDG